jgi:hypothetical protein
VICVATASFVLLKAVVCYEKALQNDFGELFLRFKIFAEILMIFQNLFGFMSSLKKKSNQKSFKNG